MQQLLGRIALVEAAIVAVSQAGEISHASLLERHGHPPLPGQTACFLRLLVSLPKALNPAQTSAPLQKMPARENASDVEPRQPIICATLLLLSNALPPLLWPDAHPAGEEGLSPRLTQAWTFLKQKGTRSNDASQNQREKSGPASSTPGTRGGMGDGGENNPREEGDQPEPGLNQSKRVGSAQPK